MQLKPFCKILSKTTLIPLGKFLPTPILRYKFGFQVLFHIEYHSRDNRGETNLLKVKGVSNSVRKPKGVFSLH